MTSPPQRSLRPLALFNGSYLGPKPTGIGVVARDLVEALDPALVPLLEPTADPPGEDAPRLRPHSIPIPANLSPADGRKGHLRRLLWTQNQLPTLLKAQGAPLLVSPLPEAPLLRGVRSVVLAHDLLPLRYPQPSPLLAYHLAYVPLVLHRATRVLCNSEATAQEVHGRLGVPLRRLITIRLGFDPRELRPLGLERGAEVLVLSRHDPHKNLGRMLQAFALVRDPEATLHLVGPHDPRLTPRLQALARDLGIDQRCRWSPWVSDQERLLLLNRCGVLVIPSLWEGFGLPALEAMACGAPVVAARAGALPEVVGNAALLVDPRQPAAIADAIGSCLREPAVARHAAVEGPRRAARFSWAETGTQLTQLLHDLV
jgi:glycosyltransferase involved in cell wall biosynthesis